RCPTPTTSPGTSRCRWPSTWPPRARLRAGRAADPPRPRRDGSVAERELRVLGHLVRGPWRREHHRRDHLLDAGELADELLHLLGDLGADRAGGGGQRICDLDAAAVDLDAVDQAELDEIQPQLGVDHLRKRFEDVVFVDHRDRSVGISTRSGLYVPGGTLYLPRIVS